MAKPTKLKTKAQIAVPQSRDEAADAIYRIGEAQRELKRIEILINDVTASITAEKQPTIDALKERINNLSEGVHTWCEAHRAEITDNNKVKFANLITGEVNWRQRPPSVKTRATEALFDKLKRLGFSHLIRNKEELDKEAILAKPELAADAGIEITTGVEDFVIVPFEQELAA